MLSRGELSEGDHEPMLTVPGYDVLGRNGSTKRWQARRLGDGRSMTLLCIPTADWEADDVQRAVDATAALARVRHRHLLGLHDVIPDVDNVDGKAALVIATAVATGGSLSTTLAARGALSLGEAVTALIPIGQALAAMHEEGYVHGRVGPEVVLFTGDGMPLLAPLWMDEVPGMGESGGDGDVAPEVIEGFQATPASDSYGYAATIWQALTGDSPGWVGARDELEELAPNISAPLSRAVSRAMLPDPSHRSSVQELMECLDGLARPAPIEMAETDVAGDVPRRIRAAARATARSPVRRERAVASHRKPHSWRRAGVAAIALIAILAGCVVAFTQWGRSSSHPATASTAAASTVPPKTNESDSELPHPPSDGAANGRELAIVQRLLDARAGAWLAGDVKQLAKAHAAGSPAMAADTERLRAATSTGDRLRGVSFTARSGAVLPVSSVRSVKEVGAPETAANEESAAYAMSVTVHRDAITVSGEGGKESTVPATTDHVTVTVVQQADGWRFYEWH